MKDYAQIIVFLVGILIPSILAHQNAAEHKCESYNVNDIITLQCRTNVTQGEGSTMIWGPGPQCHETGKEISFKYGVDTFLSCGWRVSTEAFYHQLRNLILRNGDWSCRLRMAPGHEVWIPVTIPIWGVAEADHLHINTHLNFIFHADNGKITGAAIYPVTDRFQYVRVGTTINIHGAAKHTFKDFASHVPKALATGSLSKGGLIIFIWCVLAFFFSIVIFSYLYKWYLRPTALRKVLKTE